MPAEKGGGVVRERVLPPVLAQQTDNRQVIA
jgi:hypothetical protein